uniref:Uncharacterized protein n=4 Tax=Brassica TaxID=3705 RepID=A0A0D3AXP8_BRAOL
MAKVHDLAGDDYRTSVLGPIKECRSRLLFPLQFLNALLSYLGDSGIDYRECLFSRWRFGLEFDSAMKKKELELKFEEIPPQLSGSSSLPWWIHSSRVSVAYMALVGSFPFNSFMSRFLSGIGTAVLAVYEFGTRTSVYRFCAMQFHDTYELEQNWSSSKA